MDKLIKYCNDKKLTTINITTSATLDNVKKYSTLLKTKPNVIMYFEKNELTKELFEYGGFAQGKYCILYNGKFLICNVTDNNYIRVINEVLKLNSVDTKCVICSKIARLLICHKCNKTYCHTCTSNHVCYTVATIDL